jgi:hypothetical protein
MANKKGPLSKVETFYVDAQVKLGTSVESIAVDLNRPQSSVESYIAKALKNKKTLTSEQFARQHGTTVMTENASSMIDEKRKRSPLPTKTLSCVTKIKKD